MAQLTFRINGQHYTVENDPYKFSAAELNAVERHTGMTVQEWAAKLTDRRVSSLAWSALAWIAVRRSGSFVRWDDFESDLSMLELLEGVTGKTNDEEGESESVSEGNAEAEVVSTATAIRRRKPKVTVPTVDDKL